jgi:hypothetical protein
MIWLAHIGFDRALGYGLKYSAGFSVHPFGTDREAFQELIRIDRHRR